MNRYGLTEREKAIWPPRNQTDWGIFAEKMFWFMMLCVALSILVHLTIEPKGQSIVNVAHADEKLSDYQQEKRYCEMWHNGTDVSGATGAQIAEHCSHYER